MTARTQGEIYALRALVGLTLALCGLVVWAQITAA